MNGWVFLLTFVGLSGLAAVLLRVTRHRLGRGWLLLAVASFPAAICGAAVSGWMASWRWSTPSAVPRQVAEDGYVGSASCQSCHKEQHSSWHESYHRSMTRLATPESVLGPFDVELECYGQSCRLERRGDEFWVNMPDPDWESKRAEQTQDMTGDVERPMVDKRIVMVTGSHHFQVYWVESDERSGLRQMPWYWFIKEQKWLPGIYTILEPQVENQSMQSLAFWNSVCIKCHSVAGKPKIDSKTGDFDSRVVEFGIACEACHGPGGDHVKKQKASGSLAMDSPPSGRDDTIVNPASTPPRIASQVCGQCHSGFVPFDPVAYEDKGIGFRPGNDLSATHILLKYDDPFLLNHQPDGHLSFWRDGTCRVGGDEYNGMILSPCYERGKLSCLSCHSMHNSDPDDQLAPRMAGNEACFQCHREMEKDVAAHTHHAASSKGSLCYNCHMPHTSFALLKSIRSHRIDSPSVQVSAQTGRPNACNLCHLDKTMAWTAEHLTDWFGAATPELTDEQRNVAGSLLWLEKGDGVQRIVTAWHYGWEDAQQASGKDWLAPFLTPLLDDPYSAVRYVANQSLHTLPGFEDFPYDFVADKTELRQTPRKALSIWRSRPFEVEGRDLSPVFISPKGRLRKELLDQLLGQRDDTPVSIPE